MPATVKMKLKTMFTQYFFSKSEALSTTAILFERDKTPVSR